MSDTKVALVTGGSSGLGRELVAALAGEGWLVITDGRRQTELTEATKDFAGVTAIPGDVTDFAHRDALVAAVRAAGRLDLLANNASTLGPTPLLPLAQRTVEDLPEVWRTNVGAPFALAVELLPELLADDGVLLSVSSDAAVEHYEGWGLYGAAKAALDHLTLTLAAENPALHAYAVDPGDMRTPMHRAAFPGEDISDRPEPATVIPRLRHVWTRRPPSGRYRAADLPAVETTVDNTTGAHA
ncbi:SDR family NAD(P)-dependent oxidoreductase [Flexivirga oryzae]|uniref:NAD(P)-dependent dehydrogenase (Short-subunit alcohol dehydrogenase family) n=1 Tax=Flexivirga oryzae TaxID=1794944 RepID=A0A839NH23_9MICO|nr:SDR family oxidoreductase [Flexivirga oryzae]MBB2894425.1 NAD(P)-dependent dehydrogenase (short-subunit alcohol dehydrogenase family) [Flexivirga oryzae]